MAVTTRDQTLASQHYWLSGSEMCPFCLQVYVLEMEWRCCGCDAPLCPCCMGERREAGVETCIGCGEEDADEESWGPERKVGGETTRKDPP